MTTTTIPERTSPNSISMPRILLHLEGLAVLVSAILLYANQNGDGLLFVLLLFTPDLSALGYLKNPHIGAMGYNTFHTYSLPIGLGLLSLAGGWSVGVTVALIWMAHIGMDRMLGYGLKYPSQFKDTHLNRC